MDGILWKYDKDDHMPVLQPVSLSRGRLSQPEPHAGTAFTSEQLDAIAPLSPSDVISLRLTVPSNRAIRKVQRRIQAACELKYGRHHVD